MNEDLITRLALSQKRRAAGRKGAAARWGNRNHAGRRGNSGNQSAGRDGSSSNWFRIDIRNQNGGNEADLYIYDEISWWGFGAQDLVDRLADLDNVTLLNVHINSPGGDVFDGIAIYNVLVGHQATVNVHVDGIAASVASVIAMAGDNITIGRYGQMMIHDAWGACYGNAEDMRQMADLLDKSSDNIAAVYADRAGGDPEAWRDLMKAETWFSAQEAVDAGLADEVAPLRGADTDDEEDEEVSNRVHDLSRFRFSGRANAPQPTLPKASTETSDDPDPDADPGDVAADPDNDGEETEEAEEAGETGTEDTVDETPAVTEPSRDTGTAAATDGQSDVPKVDLAALRAGLTDPADQPAAPHPPRINVANLKQALQEAT